MNISRHHLIAVGLLALGLSIGAGAVPVTSLVGSTKLTMPVLNTFGSGPATLAPGVTWTSTSADSVFGYTDGYDFERNGSWDYRKTAAGTNDANATMTFTFATAVSGFGGFMNWATDNGLASIAAYDASSRLIESSTLTFLTGGGLNSGQFLGFQESAAVIKRFTMTGAFIAGADFEVVAAAVPAVPEPSIWALSALGLGLLGLVGKRRARSA